MRVGRGRESEKRYTLALRVITAIDHLQTPESLQRCWGMALVLDGHGFGAYSLLAGHSLQRGQNSPVLILVTLHCEPALLVTVGPSQSDVVFLGLGQSHQ